jgi:hypothetical protein
LPYALQWLAFGLMALVGWVLVVRRELAERSVAVPTATSTADTYGDGDRG